MRTLQDRLRCVLQRNVHKAGHLQTMPLPGDRYRDHRGRMITVTGLVGYRSVIFKRDGWENPSELSRERFYKQFKQVEV